MKRHHLSQRAVSWPHVLNILSSPLDHIEDAQGVEFLLVDFFRRALSSWYHYDVVTWADEVRTWFGVLN